MREGNPRTVGLVDFIVGQTSVRGRYPTARTQDVTPYGLLSAGATSTISTYSGLPQSQTITMHVGLRSPTDGLRAIAHFMPGYGHGWKLCHATGSGLRFTFSGVADYWLGYSLPSDGTVLRLGVVITGSTLTTYANGAQVAQIGCGGIGGMSTPIPLSLNVAPDETPSAFIVDNVLWWRRSLSAGEIMDDASNPFAPFAPQPQWLYTGMGSGSWTPLEVSE